jgi:pyruvate formate lyase activating enzyme
VELLKTGKVDYEFRTTVVPGFVDDEDVFKIGELVKGARTFTFQQFVPDDTLDKAYETVKPLRPQNISIFADIMKKYVENVAIRL